MSQLKITYGLYMMNDQMIAIADFAMCSGVVLNRRDSRVLAFVTTGMLAIFGFCCLPG